VRIIKGQCGRALNRLVGTPSAEDDVPNTRCDYSPGQSVNLSRALANHPRATSALVPGLPTVAASGPARLRGKHSVWRVYAPAKPPEADHQKLNKEIA